MRALLLLGLASSLACSSGWHQGSRRTSIQPAAPQPPSPDAYVQVREDRFTGDRAVVLAGLHLIGRTGRPDDDLEVRLGAAPLAPSPCTKARLSLRVVSDDWRYLKCHYVDALADGLAVPLGDAEHDGDVLRAGGVSEVIRLAVSRDALIQMAGAKKLEFRVCRDEMVAGPTLSPAIGVFLDRVWPEWRAAPGPARCD